MTPEKRAQTHGGSIRRSRLAALLLFASLAPICAAPAVALDVQGGGGGAGGSGSVTGGSCGSQAVTGIHPGDAIPTCAAPTPTPTASPTPSPTPTPTPTPTPSPTPTPTPTATPTPTQTPAPTPTVVPPGSCTNCNETINAAGQVTAYANGSGGGSGVSTTGGSTITPSTTSTIGLIFQSITNLTADFVEVIVGTTKELWIDSSAVLHAHAGAIIAGIRGTGSELRLGLGAPAPPAIASGFTAGTTDYYFCEPTDFNGILGLVSQGTGTTGTTGTMTCPALIGAAAWNLLRTTSSTPPASMGALLVGSCTPSPQGAACNISDAANTLTYFAPNAYSNLDPTAGYYGGLGDLSNLFVAPGTVAPPITNGSNLNVRQPYDTSDTIDVYGASNTGTPSGNDFAARDANGVLLGGINRGGHHFDLSIANGDCVDSVGGVLSDSGAPCSVASLTGDLKPSPPPTAIALDGTPQHEDAPSNADTITGAYSGATTGDICLAQVTYGNLTSTPSAPSTPSGWTLIRGPDDATDTQTGTIHIGAWWYWHLYTSGDTAPTFSTTSSALGLVIACFSGVNETTPLDPGTPSGTGTSANYPANSLAPPIGTASVSNDYVLMGYVLDTYNLGSPVLTLPGSLTAILSNYAFNPTFQSMALGGETLSGSGSISGLAATANFNGAITAQMIALQPATSAPAGEYNVIGLHLTPTAYTSSSSVSSSAAGVQYCNSSSAITLTLPAAGGTDNVLSFANINSGLCTIAPNASDKIDGSANPISLPENAAETIQDRASGAWQHTWLGRLRHLALPFATCNGPAGNASTGWSLPSSNAASPACSADDQEGLLNFADSAIAYAEVSLPVDYLQVVGGQLNFYGSSDTTSGHTAIFSIATYCAQPNNKVAIPSSPTYNTTASVTTTIPSSASSTDLYQAIFAAPAMTGCAPG